MILYEDEALLVLDKPAGMPCTIERGGRRPAVANWLLARDPALAAVGKPSDAGLVHRLDNGTSGCLLAAKTAEAYAGLRARFDAGAIRKEYLALLVGSVPEAVEWTQPIAHHPRDAKRMLCDSRGRPARTQLTRLEWFPARDGRVTPYSYCAVTIPTGVRHQIRAHAAAAGFPLAGDRLYQSTAVRRQDTVPLGRHFLHAHRLVFSHPTNGNSVHVESPLPLELAKILRYLREAEKK
ncbi:MAG: RluA family pseudouridine synthase [Deltaproteobacteria bacterium]|nr:RluA family pseudouridine synthase [Deltaproteobacteria bacterium]